MNDLLLVNEEKMYDAYEIDFDRHWKEVITDFFNEFLLLVEPHLFEKIDFFNKPQPIEQELYPLASKQKKGKNIEDKIFLVTLKGRKKAQAAIHIEIQGDGQDVSERMLKTYYKIFDKDRKNIFSIVLVTHPSYRQLSKFHHQFYGTSILFQFQVHHLFDFSEIQLLKSNNPFALALLAGQYQAKTRTNPEERYTYKLKLTEIIKKRYPFGESDIWIKLLKFVDNILYLPHELNEQYIQEVYQIFNKEGMDMAQAEKTKEIITFGELLERWKKEGREEGRKVGRKEGIEEGKREGQFLERRKMAQKMTNAGLDIETIISLTGFSEDEIKQILKEG
ncbi:hypothetical protein NST61_03055 [Caldifermentibacillus hisashii]|uniref:hypothetical protein n=1 Tax=Caldifermentibacillus hisashii TaxID=996558 RepID=UPI0034D6DD32